MKLELLIGIAACPWPKQRTGAHGVVRDDVHVVIDGDQIAARADREARRDRYGQIRRVEMQRVGDAGIGELERVRRDERTRRRRVADDHARRVVGARRACR